MVTLSCTYKVHIVPYLVFCVSVCVCACIEYTHVQT